MHDQLQAWLRTIAVIGTIGASVFTSGMYFEHRLTVLEDGQAAINAHLAAIDLQLTQLRTK